VATQHFVDDGVSTSWTVAMTMPRRKRNQSGGIHTPARQCLWHQ